MMAALFSFLSIWKELYLYFISKKDVKVKKCVLEFFICKKIKIKLKLKKCLKKISMVAKLTRINLPGPGCQTWSTSGQFWRGNRAVYWRVWLPGGWVAGGRVQTEAGPGQGRTYNS